MAKNADLSNAKNAKKDEFYTQLEDINAEMVHYEKQFKGKTVLNFAVTDSSSTIMGLVVAPSDNSVDVTPINFAFSCNSAIKSLAP